MAEIVAAHTCRRGLVQQLVSRTGRGVVLIVVAGLALAVTTLVYLRPTLSPRAPPGAAATALATRGQVTGVVAAEFVTERDGWVDVLDGRGGTTSVFHTSDGGRHWKRQLVLPYALPAWFHFFDTRNGVALAGPAGRLDAGVLYRTADSGAHWSSVPLAATHSGGSGYLAAASFPDSNDGWYISDYRPDGFEELDVYRTADAGAHWSLQASVNPEQPEGAGLGVGPVTGLWFRDTQEGWLAQSTPGQPDALAGLYSTTDGGSTWLWRRLPAPGVPEARLTQVDQVAFPSGAELVVVARYSVGLSQRQFVYTSPDDGRTWRDPLELPSGARGTALPLGRLGILDGRHWLEASWAAVWATDDAGGHWRPVMSFSRASAVLSIQATGSSRVWAVVASVPDCILTGIVCRAGSPSVQRLLTSADGGKHWAQVRVG